jgi:DNA-binding transcriptional ArsR family regulator
MSQKISKDTPLAEITLRRYERPYDLEKRELVKKICLSLGLLQPGDSRDVIVDILLVLLRARKNKKVLNSKEIEALVRNEREKANVPMLGVSSPNIRRQLKRLKDLFLIEFIDNGYRITEFEKLCIIFDEKIKGFYLKNIISRVKEYLDEIDK